MGRRDEYLLQVAPMVMTAPTNELEDWLVAHSNLPGRRGNLELAWAFGDAFESIGVEDTRWEKIMGWLDITEDEAPTGDPREFLPFCALQALGSCYPRADAGVRRRIIAALKTAANDGRWRVREGVAMGFQRIAEWDFSVVEHLFETWLDEATLLGRRAIIASLAQPELLASPGRASSCLVIVEGILSDLLHLPRGERRTEGFRVLKKGLQYAISVFVAAAPEEGFAFIRRWAKADDGDIRSILKANLQKARLTRTHAAEVAGALAAIEGELPPA